MDDEPPADVEALMAQMRERVEAEREKHRQIVGSAEYQGQSQQLARLTSDFVATLSLCWWASTREKDRVNNSLFLRSIDDLTQSAVMVRAAINEGSGTSARRELSYMLELAIKALHVDQQMHSSPFETRLAFFDRKLSPSSISVVHDLKFGMLVSGKSQEMARSLTAAYGRACQYVHPSLHQIEERLRRREQGINPGFETAEVLRHSNEEVFEVFALVLVLLFESIGGAFSGDIWEAGGLSDRNNWIYHSHPLVAALDEHFDYKSERQHRLEFLRERRSKRLHERMAIPMAL